MMVTMTQEQVSEMFNAISPTYDRVNKILSFGIDRKWRKRLVAQLPSGPLTLLDVATGTGDQLLPLLESGKVEKAIGIDLAEEMLQLGQKKLESAGWGDQVAFRVASATEIPFSENAFDCITMSFGIRNVEGDCFAELLRVLKPGGKVLILEFSLPKNRFVRKMHLFYLRRILPFVGGLVSGNRNAYRYLNQTIEAFPYGEAFLKRMKSAGFVKNKANPLTFGIATLYVGEKP